MVSGAATGNITEGADGVMIHYINRTGYELPKTGGKGTMPYRLGGSLLLLAFAGGLVFRMRRKTPQNS